MKNNPISFLINQLETHFPEPLRPFQAEVKKAVHKTVQEKFGEFDLVTREEWRRQQQLLAEAEARIAALEARIAAAEKRPA